MALTLCPNCRLPVNPSSNTLLITDTRSSIERIGEVLPELDVRTPQVDITAVIGQRECPGGVPMRPDAAMRIGAALHHAYTDPELPVEHRRMGDESVPLASVVRGRPHRLVLFRRPVEHRAPEREDLEAPMRTVTEALRGRAAILRHHDLPWQRDRFSGAPPPPDDPPPPPDQPTPIVPPTIPMARAIMLAANPIHSDSFRPARVRLKMSRPRRSVPSGCSQLAPANRWSTKRPNAYAASAMRSRSRAVYDEWYVAPSHSTASTNRPGFSGCCAMKRTAPAFRSAWDYPAFPSSCSRPSRGTRARRGRSAPLSPGLCGQFASRNRVGRGRGLGA